MPEPQGGQSIDEAILRQLLADTGPGAFRELVAGCRVELPALAAAASRAATGRDLEALRREAHSIKGVALTFGLNPISEPAQAVEAACDAGQAEPALRLVALIRERLPATLIALGRAVEAIRSRPG
jgi:HPt (histidine-containing phosphotransfer) domain-containing protein